VLTLASFQPQRPALAVEQAIAALRAGDPAAAERTLRAHLLQATQDSGALIKLAEIVRDQGRLREAALLFRRALHSDPVSHPVRLALARLLHELGDPHQALEEVRQLPDEFRAAFDVRTFEAALLGILGRHEPEIAIYEMLVSRHPDHPALWMSLGNALKYAGLADRAVKALRRAVKLRPSYGEGWWSLANIKTARFSDRDIARMRTALRGNLAADDALHLHFALGKAFEDREHFADSFKHYDAGNRLRASGFWPGAMFATKLVDDAVTTFDGPLMARVGAVGHSAPDPIFIIGLQRSGSTLVEQILASHPLIEGTSELLAMQQLWLELVQDARSAGRSVREHLEALPAGSFAEIGAAYLDRARPFRAGDKPYFVDKLPANWMNLGFIRLVLPNARVIDARRHPMACGFSNFKQHYATGVAFAYSQDSIGRFYRDYLRLMRHFDRLQPGTVHLVLNERLIDDTEAEVRRLLGFVGVPFDAACLEFHRNARAVNTPSAEQVRRPINRDGMDFWRHYEPWLGAMKASLGTDLDQWDRPAE
jgi:tetratricopeptide (TPR) repeat protein